MDISSEKLPYWCEHKNPIIRIVEKSIASGNASNENNICSLKLNSVNMLMSRLLKYPRSKAIAIAAAPVVVNARNFVTCSTVALSSNLSFLSVEGIFDSGSMIHYVSFIESSEKRNSLTFVF